MINELRQIKILDELINEKLAEVDRLRTLAEKITVANEGERVQTSGTSDKVGDSVVKIVDLLNEINEDIDRFIDLKRDCMKKIDQLDDKLLVGILYKRYFQYLTWEAIADELHVTRQWVTEKHKRFVNSCFKLT